MANRNNKPVIFLAFANDRDDTVGYLRNLPDEARRLRDVLQPAEQAGLCEVVVRSNSTAGDIFKVFLDPKYRNRIAILHYGGHANGYELLLESATGETAVADAGGLAKFLGQQQGLQLVFLNGCSTQQQTEGLLEANISAVISTSRSIDDQVATNFSYQFYQGLAGGASVRTAYNEAEATLQTVNGGNTRALYFGDKDDSQSRLEADRWPWSLYLREGSESADQWNLPEAVNDPLFGLPTLPEQELPESPYRHLNWFTRKDAEVFFGRGRQIRELYDRLTAPRTAPIMLFYGQSGVGKSSILDAGLIPRLERDYEVRYLRRSEGGLLDTLQLAFLPEASDVPIETAWRVKEEQTGKPLIVFLDQVEELYTRPVADLPNELDQLLKVVKATFVESGQRPRGKLVFGFRKEWLAELEAQLIDYELPRTKVFLEPLDRRGIIEVVSGPARSERLRERYGLTVEDGLAEIIADDLLDDRDSAIAPTLQILLTKLWTSATKENYEHPQFSQELYHHLKRDGILLRDFLNQQIAAFRESYPEAVDSGLLLDIVALHTTPLGTADQRTVAQLQQQYAHLGATLPAILQQCQDLHLLTVAASTQKERTKTTRLAHDTLAPLVRERFDVSDKPGQRARRILDNRSVDWAGDQIGTALDEADLKVVEQGVAGTRALNSTEKRLVEASRELRARLKRLRMILKTAGAIAVAVIAVTAGVALWQWSEATTQKELAEKKTKEAEDEKDKAVRAAYNLQLARVEDLYRRDPNMAKKLLEDEYRCPTTLRDFAWGFYLRLCDRTVEYIPYSKPVNCVCFSPDGSRLATASDDGKVLLRQNDSVIELTGHTHQVRTLDFSPDGMRLASGSMGEIKIWDCETESSLVTMPSLAFVAHENKYIRTVLFVPCADGSIKLASNAENDPHLIVWDPTSGEQLWSSDQHANVSVIVNGPEEGTLIVGCEDGTFRLWKIDADAPEATVQAHDQFRKIEAMATSNTRGGGFRLVTASTDRKVMVWDWKAETNAEDQGVPPGGREYFQRTSVFGTETDAVYAAAMTSDGQKIAWGSGDRIEIRDLSNEERSLTIPRHAKIPAGENGTIQSLAFKSDGQTLASGSFDSAVLWNTEDSWPAITQTKPQPAERDSLVEQKVNVGRSEVICGATSQDRLRIALGLDDGHIIVATTDTGEHEITPIRAHKEFVQALAWSKDGTLASTDTSTDASIGHIKLWDSETGQPRGTLVGHKACVVAFAFDESGSKLTSIDENDEIREWKSVTKGSP